MSSLVGLCLRNPHAHIRSIATAMVYLCLRLNRLVNLDFDLGMLATVFFMVSPPPPMRTE